MNQTGQSVISLVNNTNTPSVVGYLVKRDTPTTFSYVSNDNDIVAGVVLESGKKYKESCRIQEYGDANIFVRGKCNIGDVIRARMVTDSFNPGECTVENNPKINCKQVGIAKSSGTNTLIKVQFNSRTSVSSHFDLTDIGTNDHATIDLHIAAMDTYHIQGVLVDDSAIADGYVLKYDLASGNIVYSAITSILPPATTVVSETNYNQSSAVGISTNYAREDHSHGSPNGATTIGFRFDGYGGTVAAHSFIGYLRCPYTGTITGWNIYEASETPVASTCVVDIWKKATFYPQVADTIFGTKPSLTAATNNSASGLSIAVTVGDLFACHVDSNNTAKIIVVQLHINRT